MRLDRDVSGQIFGVPHGREPHQVDLGVLAGVSEPAT